jgi:hypothetical protein
LWGSKQFGGCEREEAMARMGWLWATSLAAVLAMPAAANEPTGNDATPLYGGTLT